MKYDSVLALLDTTPIVYVDCGARAGSAPAWLKPAKTSEYIGIEADQAECDRLTARGKERHRYISAVLGRAKEARTLHVTRNPSCSSLLPPNAQALTAFSELRDFFIVERELPVTTVTLDDSLQSHEIRYADFLELDVQGAELDVLAGAERLLSDSVLGLQVEVEFVEMYRRQPLFGDVDAFLRARGFELFDLARYHVRRGPLEPAIPTRGQLVWGQATYLRRHDDDQRPALLRRLAAVAALIGVPDFAIEILEGLDVADEIVRHAKADLGRAGGTRVWRD